MTVNHRLNAIGCLFLAELGVPDLADSGNAGMLDLVLALEWVPERVGTGDEPGRLGARMSEAWIAFARTGNPNTSSLPRWTPYALARRSTMVFDAEPRIVDDPRGVEHRFFAQVPYVQPGT